MKAIALIDGEHHPAVCRDTLAGLAPEFDLRAALFVGGKEKVPATVLDDPRPHYGVDVIDAGADAATGLARLADATGAEVVLDLSGDPVLGPGQRLELAAVALDRGLSYQAPGLRLTPPAEHALEGGAPVVSVIGTGKRCGKTAVAGHFARCLTEAGVEPVLVAMGRGGPAEPTLVRADERPDREQLLAIARAGGHAASDYLEGAVLAGVTTVGCRRCGEGPAGEVFGSNVLAGARLAASLSPDAIVLEGSGAAIPPVASDRTVCVVRARTARADALGYLGPVRLLRSQLILLTGLEEVSPDELADLRAGVARWCGDTAVLACTLDPEPAANVPADARVALFSTAPAGAEPRIRARLAERGVDVVVFSSNLADRGALDHDLARAVRERCDLFLTELKAAAIDTVAERAEREGAAVVFLRNRPVSPDGEDLDGALMGLFEQARAAAGGRRAAASAR